MKRNVFNCFMKEAREVAVVTLVGRLFHARAVVTRKEWSPMIRSCVLGTISRCWEPDHSRRSDSASSVHWRLGVTVAVAAGDDGNDWSMVSVFFWLTVRPKRLAVSKNVVNSDCTSASVWATSAQSLAKRRLCMTADWTLVAACRCLRSNMLPSMR